MKPSQNQIDEFHERGDLSLPEVTSGSEIAAFIDRERETHA